MDDVASYCTLKYCIFGKGTNDFDMYVIRYVVVNQLRF
jgi:hypothetical protein